MTGTTIQIPTLQTERLVLRASVEADFEPLAAFYASGRSHLVGGPMTRLECWRYLASVIGHWHLRGWGRWTCVDRASGAPAGLIGLHAPEGWPEPEIGWMMFDGFEGRGLAHEAALESRRYAYEVAGWTTAISLIDPANHRSAALAGRMGAAIDGVYEHSTYGTMNIWRHPAPGEVEA